MSVMAICAHWRRFVYFSTINKRKKVTSFLFPLSLCCMMVSTLKAFCIFFNVSLASEFGNGLLHSLMTLNYNFAITCCCRGGICLNIGYHNCTIDWITPKSTDLAECHIIPCDRVAQMFILLLALFCGINVSFPYEDYRLPAAGRYYPK